MSETLDHKFRARLAWCEAVGIEFDGTPDEDELDEAIIDYVTELVVRFHEQSEDK